MKVTPFSPDPDKHAEPCEACDMTGYEEGEYTDFIPYCPYCKGTGITVDWTVVEPALLGEK